MERVLDLLDSSQQVTTPLRVREHPLSGPFVEGLTIRKVTSYEAIEEELEKGGRSRTVASTSMNAKSSRSHAIFTLSFTQVFQS